MIGLWRQCIRYLPDKYECFDKLNLPIPAKPEEDEVLCEYYSSVNQLFCSYLTFYYPPIWVECECVLVKKGRNHQIFKSYYKTVMVILNGANSWNKKRSICRRLPGLDFFIRFLCLLCLVAKDGQCAAGPGQKRKKPPIIYSSLWCGSRIVVQYIYKMGRERAESVTVIDDEWLRFDKYNEVARYGVDDLVGSCQSLLNDWIWVHCAGWRQL